MLKIKKMMKLKRPVSLQPLIVAIMSMACTSVFSQSSTVTINGKVSGNTNGMNKIYVISPSAQDSTVIKDGKFSMVVPISSPVTQLQIVTEYELANPDVAMGRFRPLFLTSPGTLNVQIDDIGKGAKGAKLSGIPSVEEYEQYLQAEAAMYKSVRNELEPVYGVKKSIDPRDPVDSEYMVEFEKLTNTAKKKCKIVMLTSSINPQDFSRSKKYDNVKLYLNKPLSHESIMKLEV